MTQPVPECGSRLVLLAGPGVSTNIIARALRANFGEAPLILEQPVPRWRLARRRAARLGYSTVFGQVLFSALAVPVMAHRGRNRVRSIVRAAGLDPRPVVPDFRVPTVNSELARALLRRLAPVVVVVNGTRIISPATLSCVASPFINLHAGITPRYRGVHGGYWALVEGRPEMMGSTVHLVDPGIDTGGILGQATFEITKGDSFVTYPYLHLVSGLPLLMTVVADLLAGRSPVLHPSLDGTEHSQLRWHPTLWGYLFHWARGTAALRRS